MVGLPEIDVPFHALAEYVHYLLSCLFNFLLGFAHHVVHDPVGPSAQQSSQVVEKPALFSRNNNLLPLGNTTYDRPGNRIGGHHRCVIQGFQERRLEPVLAFQLRSIGVLRENNGNFDPLRF